MFFIVCVFKIYFVLSFQLLLVSGGNIGSEYTSTTELFNGAIWFNVGRLPWGMRYFPIINIDNRILAFGRRHLVRFYCKFLMFSGGLGSTYTNPRYKNNIYEFDTNKQEWTYGSKVGFMPYAAHGVGVSEVKITDFEPWCQHSSRKKIIPHPLEQGKRDDVFPDILTDI